MFSARLCRLAASIHDAPFMHPQEWKHTARKTLKPPVIALPSRLYKTRPRSFDEASFHVGQSDEEPDFVF